MDKSDIGVEFAMDRILVAFQDGTTPSEKTEILARTSPYLRLGANSGSPFFDVVQIAGEAVAPNEVAGMLKSDPRVRVAEPDYVVHTQEKIPNDPYFPYLWGLRNTGQGAYGATTCKTCSKPGADISAAKAWDITTGSSQVIVAVIDTGVDYTHPDLTANILRDSSNKVVGYDYVNNDSDPMDDYGHGTHCAGTIGAAGNNGVGVVGVCWNVKIMPLKFLDATGSGYTSNAILCVDFAIAHGAHVMSNSWGGGGFSQLLLDAIHRAEKAGILFVAAAGNSAYDIDQGGFYPAGYNLYSSNVVAVAATDDYDEIAYFSNYGPGTCDIAAPGYTIFSTLPSGSCPLCASSGYGYLSGTSMATPHVAGAAALVKSQFPAASSTQLKARLLYSADHPSEMSGYTRYGRLNVFNSMQSDTTPPGAPSSFSITQASGTGLRLTWTASGDDNLSGTVSGYQIFYNTIPDLTTATIVEPRMTPGPPGTAESSDLTGLTPQTVYYISIRAVDKVGNLSSIVSADPVMTNSASFYDGAESTALFSTSYGLAWSVTTGDSHTGSHSYASSATPTASQWSLLQMTNLFAVTGPSYLTFWARLDTDSSRDYLELQVTDMKAGSTSYTYIGGGVSSWTRYRYDLSSYAGHPIQVGFYLYIGSSTASPPSHRVWVDDVAIVQLTKGWEDDVEGTAQFTGFPPWSITTENSSSPTHAWSDSPYSNYANNVHLPLMQNSSVNVPSNLGSPQLVFKAKTDLEANRDYLQVFASPDDGANWNYLGSLTGTADWTIYTFDLPGWTRVRALFLLETNEALTRDGVYLDDIGVWGESFTAAKQVSASASGTSASMPILAGGVGAAATGGSSATAQAGYATAVVSSGGTPYGTAVFSSSQGNIVVSEAAVSASPPTTAARLFVDYRTGVAPTSPQSGVGTVDISTGVAIVNCGTASANVTYTLFDGVGALLAVGHGNIAAGSHLAKFIQQLSDAAPDFNIPANFATSVKFGSLEIDSDQPLSVLALRLTVNQRGDLLLTSTPVADLTKSVGSAPLYFPQVADGGGYITTLILLNTSTAVETGKISFFRDDGTALTVETTGGIANSVFTYSILPRAVFVLQTDGTPTGANTGWVQVKPDASNLSPVGAGVFAYSQGGIRVTESGVSSAVATTHARIYIDRSGGHETGLALACPGSSGINIALNAYQADGSTAAGSGTLNISGNGHTAQLAGQLISSLPSGFTGVLDISSTAPFVALTLRVLTNARGDSLMTTFPVADMTQLAPAPVVFPHIVDGGGYVTQFILLSAGPAANATVNFYDEKGVPLAVGKR
jgi:subtilisin family serine protease